MKNYVILVINKTTNKVEHAGTSDAPIDLNPFGDMAATHSFKKQEFDNVSNLISAREVIDNIDEDLHRLKATADRTRFKNYADVESYTPRPERPGPLPVKRRAAKK